MERQLAAAFVEATDALVCVVDGDGGILLVNPALQQFTGRTAEELMGRCFWEVWVLPEHRPLAQEAVELAMASGQAFMQEADWLAAGGERRRVSMHNSVLVDGAGRPYAIGCVAIDVTDQRRWEAQLSERAETDRLTGIPHRGALFDALRRQLDPRTGAGCAVLFCDLDQFKAVNDLHGHAVGDGLLVAVAARLRDLVKPGELVARFGGDEFVIVTPQQDADHLAELAAAVEERVGEPLPGPAGELSVGVSVGIAVGLPGDSADELIALADLKMYGVKTRRSRRAP